MNKEILSEQEFAEKVWWEGSLVDAFVYGLTPQSCTPGKLQDLLVPAYEAFLKLDPAYGDVVNYLDHLDDENGDDK